MKILQVIPYFTPKRGGPVNVCYNLSKELAHRGNDVTIITTDFEFDKNYAASLETAGVKIIPIKCVANIGLFLYSPAMKSWLEANLKNFDVIHMHDFRSYQNNVIYQYAKKFGIPYLVQPHGSLPKIVEKKAMKGLYDIAWGKTISNASSKMIAVSNIEVNQFLEFGIDSHKIVVIPNGIDLAEFDNLPQKGEFKQKYGMAKNRKMILFLGRIHQTKGLDLLVKAFAELEKMMNDLSLVIIGPDGGNLKALKQMIEKLKIREKVFFAGQVSQEDKLKAYIDADVFVTPSFYGFPVTFVEACACGTPIITTKKGDYLDWINQVGFIVSYNKCELANTIAKILVDQKLSKQFGEKGKELVHGQFNWETITRKLEQIYESVL